VTELGSKADPENDAIRVSNTLLKGPERHEYIVLNKPRGYVTTVSDPEGRPTIMELVRSKGRVYPVGRLDFNSEGLLLLTNDGALTQKLMKAASHIPKTYLVKISGQPAESQLRRLRAGVSIAEERNPGQRVRTAPAEIRVIKEADNPWLEIILHEGRNRQIRKMFEEIGHHVEKIRRVRYGPLELDLDPGESRPLSAKEIALLRRATEPNARRQFPRASMADGVDRTRRATPPPSESTPNQPAYGEERRPEFRRKERTPRPVWKEQRFRNRSGHSAHRRRKPSNAARSPKRNSNQRRDR
jgi:23S rRNA pseudouridine2605 synthase